MLRQIQSCHKISSRTAGRSLRKPIYTLVDHYMAYGGLSEEEPLNKANDTLCSVPTSTLKAKLKGLGIKIPNATDTFAATFAKISC
jgi:hypothetical protein